LWLKNISHNYGGALKDAVELLKDVRRDHELRIRSLERQLGQLA
jgi:hypothetical protein